MFVEINVKIKIINFYQILEVKKKKTRFKNKKLHFNNINGTRLYTKC